MNGYYGTGDTLPVGAAVGDVRNQVGSDPNDPGGNNWDNFIDRDPDRFYIRVTDPTKNTSATSRNTVTVTLGTLDANGIEDDVQTEITLTETANNSGVFVSESQLLTAPDLVGVAAADQDDGFRVASAVTGFTVGDEDPNDRTHRATIDSAVRVEYGPDVIPRQIPVSRRAGTAPDERKELELRTHVFLEPFSDTGYDHDADPATPAIFGNNDMFDYDDVNGDGRQNPGEPSEPFTDISGDGITNTVLGNLRDATSFVNAQVNRAKSAWAQAGIRIDLAFTGFSLDRPPNLPGGGPNVFADHDFDMDRGAGLAENEEMIIDNTAGAATDVLEVFFVPRFDPNDRATGAANVPSLRGADGVAAANAGNSYVFISAGVDIRRRTLAHELWHALSREGDVERPVHIFGPSRDGASFDELVTQRRRITHALEATVRTAKAAGDLTAGGNSLLQEVV